MPSWNMSQLRTSIQQRDIQPLYCLFGEETYLIEEYLKTLIDLALDGGLADFNLDVFHGNETEPTQIVDAAGMLPMMAGRRVVVIREAQDLKAKDFESLMPLIDAPVETTTLILVAFKIDQRTKFFKKFSDRGCVIKFERPFENQMPSWIQYIAKKYQKDISPDAIDLVHQLVGVSLMDVDHEIKKLVSYIGDKTVIELEDVQQATSRLRINSIFALAQAIGQNDRAAALMCLANLLDHGESPIGIVALVARHVRLLMLAREALEAGLGASQISVRIGVPGTFAREYIDQARVWSELKLESTHHALYETDRALKSSPISSHIWLENFIIKTCAV